MPSVIDDPIVERFSDLFVGNLEAHGQFTYLRGKFQEGEKVLGEGKTLKVAPSLETYRAHLAGDTGLGIIPINTQSECRFCVVDFDIYSSRAVNDVLNLVDNLNLPLLPFTSKSGGLHLYVFFSNFFPVNECKSRVLTLINKSGISFIHKKYRKEEGGPFQELEVFPKQNTLNVSGKVGVGNWINIPYFDHMKTKSGLLKGNKILPIEEALEICELAALSTNVESLEESIATMPDKDIPPCLQLIHALKPSLRNNRNNYLFNLGIMLRKKDPDSFEEHLFAANRRLEHPLEERELASTIIASLTKTPHTYTYRCTSSPSVQYCIKDECKLREYGIDGEEGYFSNLDYGDMFQYNGMRSYYEWEVRVPGQDFIRMRFDSEAELINQNKFRQLSVRYLHILPAKIKESEWSKIVQNALSELEIIDLDPREDDSPENMVRTYISDFISERSEGTKTLGDVLLKRVYYDEESSSFLFYRQFLTEYLFNKGAHRMISENQFGLIYRMIGIASAYKTIDNRRYKLAKLPKKLYLKIALLPSSNDKFTFSGDIDDSKLKDKDKESLTPLEKMQLKSINDSKKENKVDISSISL